MALRDGYRFQQLTADDLRDVLTLDAWAFPSTHAVDDLMKVPAPLSWDRARGVLHDAHDPDAVPVDGAVPTRSELVGLHASYPFAHFPVPGAELAASGLTWVGVHPGHRRRGILTAMIDEHLARSVARGEAVSVLTASETGIYGRFGYGKAADDLRLALPRGTTLRDVPGADEHTVRIELVDPARHAELGEDLHRRAGRDVGGSGLNRPGWVSRETSELREYYWTDTPQRSGGSEPERIIIVERDGEPRGYTQFRRNLDWEQAGPNGRVASGEMVALDAAAARALWGVLLDLDLTGIVRPFVLPVDDPITSLVDDLRGCSPILHDNVWLRVLDVPAALAGRRYAADVDVVIEVHDARLATNEGRWRVRASAFEGDVEVSATHEGADLTLDVRELGAAYLGGTNLAALAAGGLVQAHSSGALASASAAFSWPVAPASSWIF